MEINTLKAEVDKNIALVRETLGDNERFAYIYTFGCQQNEADSEKIRGMAYDMGYKISAIPDDADLIVINTCAIREHAEMKALSMLGRFKSLKKKNPNLVVGVMGCMAAEPHVSDMLKKDFHYVSFTLEPGMLYKMPGLILNAIAENKRSFVFGTEKFDIVEGLTQVRESSYRAWVSIMYGCNNFCSYCIVPYVRGRERSRRSADVIEECRSLVDLGYKEITLLGQNVNSYRSDIDFSSLLERIANIPGDFIIRFMTSHPKDASDELFRVMGKYSGKIAPYFHLPLQSGSNDILKAMNRTYNRDKFLSIVEKLRASVPGIALTSDVIVGFPGEREVDFNDTMDLLKSIRFDMVYSFIYSPRVGTRAAIMENQISEDVKNERMKALLDLQTQISYEKNHEYVGTTQRVLVDSVTKKGACNIYDGRTATNKLVHFETTEDSVGKFKYVKIDRAGAFDLFATEI